MKILWFVAGAAAGSAIGLVLAPRSGEETRDRLYVTLEEGKLIVEDVAEGLREMASDLVEQGKQMIEQQRDSIRDAMEVGQEAYRRDLQARRERLA